MNNKKIFNKLVRDRIPEIIKNNGEVPEIETLDDLTYNEMLYEKLLEECNEFLNAEDNKEKVEEVADIMEVLYAIMDTLDVSKENIENIRLDKAEKRGAFKKKILLKSTFKKEVE